MGLRVNGRDGLYRDPHFVVGAMNTLGIDETAAVMAEFIGHVSKNFAGDADLTVASVKRVARYDVARGSNQTAPGRNIHRRLGFRQQRPLADHQLLIKLAEAAGRASRHETSGGEDQECKCDGDPELLALELR